MTTYRVSKNVVLDDIALPISNEFVETYPVAFIRHPISVSVSRPSLNIHKSMAIDSTISFEAPEPSAELQGGTFSYNTSAGDCYILTGQPSATLYGTTTTMFFGCPDDYNMGERWLYSKVWIPFTLDANISNGDTIISAILTVKSATDDGARYPVKFKFGCQLVGGDVATPTSYNDLNSRTLTSNFTTANITVPWVVGQAYTFDITTAVQEIVNRAAWGISEAKKIAVMCLDNGSGTRCFRSIYTYENGSNYPTLAITV